MIPKTIHYCWFGNNKKPKIVKKCLKSWKKLCPDYDVLEWNEQNYDVNKIPYIQEAYQNKKWAFVSDYVRLDVIYQYGGIYLDTDVEIIKSLNHLQNYRCFVASDGCGINTGIGFGSEQKHECIRQMMNEYAHTHFINDHGMLDLTPSTFYNTKPFLTHGFNLKLKEIQEVNGVIILPPEFFSPKDAKTFSLNITENTCGIHWESRLWETGMTRLKANLRLKIGVENTRKLKTILKKFKNDMVDDEIQNK